MGANIRIQGQNSRERERLMSMETIKTGEKRIKRTNKIMIRREMKKEIKLKQFY